MALWSTNELASLGRLVPGDALTDITGVCIDSRQIQPGDLFIALSGDPGPRFHGGVDNPRDGHEFIQGAVAGGASVILLSNPPANISVPYIQVADTLDGLWDLGRVARDRCDGAVVAITGSAGKTTAKTWLSECLSAQARVHSSVGSLNNHWGVPLSLSRMPVETEVSVIEVGTNHPGEIAPLSKLAQPNVAMLLNVLPAHVGNFESLAALTKEKLSIAAGLKSGGKFVLPVALASGLDSEVTFGLEQSADVSGEYTVESGVYHVEARVRDQVIHYELNEGGEHRVLTSLAVLAVVDSLGYSASEAAKQFAVLGSPVGRGNRIVTKGITVIDDSYNANPVSMIYSINGLAQQPGRRIALLGEILELGEQSETYHREVASHFVKLDRVITFGNGFANHSGYDHFDAVEQFDLQAFVSELRQGDQILVKGSNKVFWQKGFIKSLRAAIEQGL